MLNTSQPQLSSPVTLQIRAPQSSLLLGPQVGSTHCPQHHLHLPLQAQPPQQLRTDDALGPSSPIAPTSARACVSLNQNNPTAPTDLNPCSTQTAQSQSPEVPPSPPPVFWRFLEVLIVLVFPPPPGPLWCECTCDPTEPIRGFT